jgi:predicted porin
MMKQILAAAVAAAVLVPAASAATNNVVVYGKVDMAVTKADREGAGADDWFIHENGGASKLGFKGTEDLGNGLKAIWKMEFDVEVARSTGGTNPLSGGNSVGSTRNAYVGLAGDWGTALMGRHDTPYKMAFGKWDVFADTIADFNNSNMGQFEDERAQDAIAYVSPSMNGLSFAGAIVTGSANENSAVAGQEEDINEHYSLAVNYNNNGIMAAVAYEVLSEDTLTRLGVGDANNSGDSTKIGVALGYKGNGFFVGGRYDDMERARKEGGGADASIWALMASYDFGNNTVKGTYQARDIDTNAATGTEPTAWAIGVDHNFSKRTKAYALYTDFDSDGAGSDASFFSVGMSHSF